MTYDIRPATAGDIPAAAHALTLAFAEYPWTEWTIPSDDHLGRLQELQSLYLGHALEHGLVVVDDAGRGVAAAVPPSAPAPSEHLQARVAELHGDRLPLLMAAALPPAPEGAWDFATLGVRPDARGGGLGTRLIDAVLTAIDAQDPHNTISLETSDERNVRLYERHGFVTSARTELQDGPVVYSMVRRR